MTGTAEARAAPAREPALDEAARGVLLAAAAALAVSTPIVHLSGVLGIPFRACAPVVAALSTAAAAFVLWKLVWPALPGLRATGREAALLGGLCAATGLLLLLVQHATSDDSSYLPPVVRCLAHPGEPPGYYGFLWVGDPLATSPRWALPVPFDFLEGTITRFTGVPLLAVRYLVAPPLLASLVPLAWFHLLARAGFGTRAALAGTLAGGAALFLLRDTQDAPGTAFILRVYQAKFFAAAVLLPLFAAEAWSFLRDPAPRRWLLLAAVATAAAGSSLSSLLLVLLLAPALVLAGVAAEPGRWRRALLLLPAVSYAAAAALWIHADARAGLSTASAANLYHPRTFTEQILLVFGGPLTPAATAAGVLAALLLLDGQARRWTLGWTAAVLLLYLNPLAAPAVIEHLASNIYWRIPYILPWPLLLGVPAAAWVARREAAGARLPTLPAVAAAALLLLLQVPAQAGGLYRSLQLVRPLPDPDRCLNVEVAADARWIAAHAPEGPFLGPRYLSTILVMVDADRPPIVHWPEPVRFWMERVGRPAEGELRLRAARGMEGGLGPDLAAVAEVLRLHPEVRSAAALPGALAAGLDAVLGDAGFRLSGTGPSGIRLFVR